MLRAYTSWPGVFTSFRGERVKILEAGEGSAAGRGAPGTIEADGGKISVAAGAGTSLVVGRLQREGRSPVSGAEFLRGLRETEGARFGGA
jgi:methionyl-tRNA formyltransferase